MNIILYTCVTDSARSQIRRENMKRKFCEEKGDPDAKVTNSLMVSVVLQT